MITGFNTDVEHDGVVYHVQTEDKGLESPQILSLVYSGGAILASKRSSYEDLIAAGFNEETLAERLKRQHRLICAAILAGRVSEFKRANTRETRRPASDSLSESGPVGSNIETIPKVTPDGPEPPPLPPKQEDRVIETSRVTASRLHAFSVHDARRQSSPGEPLDSDQGLRVRLLDERDFHAGEFLTLRIMVSFRSGKVEKPRSGVPVSVKVLGTTFRPLIHSVQTEADGVAVLSTRIPPFTSGRAAILVRAVAEGNAVEIRRVIHPAH